MIEYQPDYDPDIRKADMRYVRRLLVRSKSYRDTKSKGKKHRRATPVEATAK